jgi:VanZ family protein
MMMEAALFIFGTLAVSAGCLVPARWLPPLPNDKLLHFLAFGGLALLAARMAQDSHQRIAALLAVFAIGLVIELLQNAVPGRRFCWRDLLANTIGIAVAAFLA